MIHINHVEKKMVFPPRASPMHMINLKNKSTLHIQIYGHVADSDFVTFINILLC